MNKKPIDVQIAPHEVFPVLMAISLGLQAESMDPELRERAGWFHQRLLAKFDETIKRGED